MSTMYTDEYYNERYEQILYDYKNRNLKLALYKSGESVYETVVCNNDKDERVSIVKIRRMAATVNTIEGVNMWYIDDIPYDIALDRNYYYGINCDGVEYERCEISKFDKEFFNGKKLSIVNPKTICVFWFMDYMTSKQLQALQERDKLNKL